MSEPQRAEPRFGGEFPERVDVVVVGGGIAGTSTAHHLARAGVRTLLLERGRIGSGATAAAIGVLSPPMRQPFDETVHFRGANTARTIWELALRSVAGLGVLLQERGKAEETELDLSGGHVLADAHTLHQVEGSFRALEQARLPVEWLTGERVREVSGGRGFLGGYRIEGGGALNPGRTAVALAGIAEEEGAAVVEEVDVGEVRRTGGVLECETGRGPVRAEMVVYATHVDSRRFSAFLGDEIVPIRGQGMIAEGTGMRRYAGSFATHWKLNVWRSDAPGRLHLGGWRHDAWDRSYWKVRPEIDEPLQENIQGWYESAFPDQAPLSVVRRWSGIFGWTADYLPLVGPLPGRTGELVVSGFSGGGLPFAFESGRIIASIVKGTEPIEGSELFNPRRFA
ncbi:MAG TPA: FAD-binding oxidoreductase [Longimicrobiales bacterium]|nr:FAD-binding oxidoreductase [Longimicrobiales bacterium]